MKFRPRTDIIIEAEQFIPDVVPWPTGVTLNHGGPSFEIFDYLQSTSIKINPTDWIITGTKGEKYPCADAVFKEKYEPA